MIDAIHYVIDLETMGKGPRAAIVAIGAVRVEHGQPAGEFYCRVDLASSLGWGLEPDSSTIQWWLKQSTEARTEVDGSIPGVILPAALDALGQFILSGPTGARLSTDPLVWGNGATFDNVILTSAYTACGMERPWKYWNDRDLRTLLNLYPEAKTIEFDGIKHHAMHDARHEAKQLGKALSLHAAQAESRIVLADLLRQATTMLADPDMTARRRLASLIEGELENNPLLQVEREEVSHG